MAAPAQLRDPLFGDLKHQEIRELIRSIQMFPNDTTLEEVSTILMDWNSLCLRFQELAKDLKPINDKMISWNPSNTLTRKVKIAWETIYGGLNNPEKTDRREQVLANILILDTLCDLFDRQEVQNQIDRQEVQNQNMKLQTEILTKIEEFFPEQASYSAARNYARNNHREFNQFREQLDLWTPENIQMRALKAQAQLLLEAVGPKLEKIDPQSPFFPTELYEENQRLYITSFLTTLSQLHGVFKRCGGSTKGGEESKL